jgi:hypothetical protein
MRILPGIAACFLAGMLSAAPQDTQKPTPHPDKLDESAERKAQESGAIFGKIKGIEAGQKIVIEVDKGKDRTYNLADPKRSVNVAEDLAVGDRVKVLESENKSVQIVRAVTDSPGTEGERSRKR